MIRRNLVVRSQKPIPRRRRKPRRGVVRDKKYLAWLHTQPCIICGWCGYFIEVHHVDKPRNDRRAIPLLQDYHRVTPYSVHGGGGRRRFEERWDISFEAEIARLNQKYEAERKQAA